VDTAEGGVRATLAEITNYAVPDGYVAFSKGGKNKEIKRMTTGRRLDAGKGQVDRGF